MKALVLAGGRGSRINEFSENHNKCMHPVKGRPVLEYSLDNAIAAAVDEIVIVVGYRAEEIINHYGTCYRDVPVQYVIQWEQRGLVHAIETAAESLQGSDFLLLLGDEVMRAPRHAELVQRFREPGCFAVCGLLEVEDRSQIGKTYTVMTAPDGQIYRLVEKPKAPLNNLMGTGDCVFDNRILSYIPLTPLHHERGERELPDLVQCAVDDGKLVQSFLVCDGYANVNTLEDAALAEALLAP